MKTIEQLDDEYKKASFNAIYIIAAALEIDDNQAALVVKALLELIEARQAYKQSLESAGQKVT